MITRTDNVMKRGGALRTLDKIFKVFLMILLVAYCISLLIPLFWMLTTSVKDGFIEYNNNKFGWPEGFVIENYAHVFERLKITVYKKGVGEVAYGIWDMLMFSIVYSIAGPLYSIILTALVAYVMSKYKFPGNSFLYALGIFVMITPIIGSGAAAMSIRKSMHIYDNMFLLILTSPSCVFSGLNFMLLYGMFKKIPWTYAEAVFMDGGGNYTVLFKIMLPLALPTCTALFVLGFLGSWNDYGTFLIWLPSYPNLAYGMYYFQENQLQYGATMPELMAGFVMIIVPTTILFTASQKLIMSKFSVGGIKG